MKRLLTLILFFSLVGLSQTMAQELEPRFPGCDQVDDYDCADMKMMQFIYSNLKHPDAAKDAGVSGTVVIAFKVGSDGAVTAPNIIEGLGSGCDEEAKRIVGLMPKWLPATDAEGNPIDMEWEIEVKFK